MLSTQNITYSFAPGSQVVWNLPSKPGPGMPVIWAETFPDCQKPPRSDSTFTVPVIFCMAPPGSMAPSPVHCHLPSKKARAAISDAGAGMAGAPEATGMGGLSFFPSGVCADTHGTAATKAAVTIAPLIHRTFICPPRERRSLSRERAHRQGQGTRDRK